MRAKALNFWLGGLLSLGLFSLPTSAMAIDGSDAESPKVESVNLINLGEIASDSRVIIEVKTSDDKNMITFDGNLNFETTYPKEFENMSPLCREANQIGYGKFFSSGLGFYEDKTLFSNNDRIRQTFYRLVKYPYFKSELPSGCPDLRDAKYFKVKINMNLRDGSGRTTSTSQYIDMVSQPTLSIADEKADYFCLGINKFNSQIEEVLKYLPGNKATVKYPDGIDSEINLKFVQNARAKSESTMRIVNQPTLEALKKVPSCNLQEFRFLTDRSANLYQQVLIAQSEFLKKAQISITCVKGKITKKITGRDPKCPAGYKQK